MKSKELYSVWKEAERQQYPKKRNKDKKILQDEKQLFFIEDNTNESMESYQMYLHNKIHRIETLKNKKIDCIIDAVDLKM